MEKKIYWGLDTISPESMENLTAICQRAKAFFGDEDIAHIMMDLCACNANGCPLDFKGLLTANTADFLHDIHGINQHVSHEDGTLQDCFVPRYALKYKEA